MVGQRVRFMRGDTPRQGNRYDILRDRLDDFCRDARVAAWLVCAVKGLRRNSDQWSILRVRDPGNLVYKWQTGCVRQMRSSSTQSRAGH